METGKTYCSGCGAEMDSSAKTCPQCGKKNTNRKKPIYKKWWFWAIIAIVILVIAASGGSSEPTKVGENTPVADTSQASGASGNTVSTDTAFAVGDKVELNNIIVTLDSVAENNGSAYNKPGDGNVFALCTFTIENNSSSEINISSLLCFDAYCDGYACNLSLTAQLESDGNQLDGTVAAGKKMKGTIGYEIAADWSELEIHFTPDFWAQKDIVFVASR